MSKFEFKLPDIGEGVSEGEIVNWLVKVGDGVKEDQDLVEVMTDKATVTIGAPKSGKITELKGEVGDVVPVGQVLVVFDVENGGGSAEAKPAPKAEAKEAKESKPEPKASEAKPEPKEAKAPKETKASAVGDIKEDLPGMAPPAARSGSSNGAYFNDKPLAAPATRKLARELDVDLRRVQPSGPNERVTREDVEAYAKGGAPAQGKAPAHEPSRARDEAYEPAPLPPAPRPVEGKGDERIPIRGMKKRMFESMARSKRTAAHFTYWEEAEVSELIALRDRIKPLAEAEGVKLNFLPLIVKAVVASLRKNPFMNAVIDEEKSEIVVKHTYDIGIAVATDNGLIVPVLRGADQRGILDISREIDRLSSEARAGKARREDLGGSSFTITSLGKLGGSFATPVINVPEVGILYIPQIKQKPVVKNGQIVVGNTMNLGMSFDHRVIDGATGAQFTQDVAALLENPDKLLLNM
ncbi:MAG TPA: dihydrolipoamide acetyltransferase family protein [Polyangiaceae bacterium]|nr:dihydrolipoamide acetyltransferase family protein [Polyangiaceae bacterium]